MRSSRASPCIGGGGRFLHAKPQSSTAPACAMVIAQSTQGYSLRHVVNVPGVGPLVAVDTGSGWFQNEPLAKPGEHVNNAALSSSMYSARVVPGPRSHKACQAFRPRHWTQPQRISEL